MEFKRRRMIKSEIDRLLSDEGTRNLLSGIKALQQKSKKLTRTRNVTSTRNVVVVKNRINRKPNNTNVNGNSGLHTKEKSKKIIKKSLSLLGHHGKVVNKAVPNGKTSSAGNRRVQPKKQTNGAVKLKNGNPLDGGNGIVKTSLAAKLQSSTSLGSSSSNVNGSSSSNSSTTPSHPLLATIIRDHVAFITMSYNNHLCVLKTQDLRDLVRKLEEYESRKGISVIVLNSSSDRIFCDGLDYKELIHSDLNKRKQAVQRRIHSIKNFLTTLAKCKKLLVASVNGGKVNGFGLMLLALFDLVYANDKATFSLQKYFQMKQPPEGVSTFNQGQLTSPTMKSFVYMGRVFTASEIHENNFLVTEILWDGRYHEQLASKLQNINSHEHTKSIYKTYSFKTTKQVSNDLAHEFNVLESIWMSDSWQTNFLKQQNSNQ